MMHGRKDAQVTLTKPLYGFSRHCIRAEAHGQYRGDRTAGVCDVSGNAWWLASRQQDLTPDSKQAASTFPKYRANIERTYPAS